MQDTYYLAMIYLIHEEQGAPRMWVSSNEADGLLDSFNIRSIRSGYLRSQEVTKC